MDQCFNTKDLNPTTCKFSVKCKPGFGRDHNFKCVKMKDDLAALNTGKIPVPGIQKNTTKKRKESTKKMSQLLDEIANKIINETSKPGIILRSLKSIKTKLLNSNGLNERYSEIVDLFKATYDKNTKSIELVKEAQREIEQESSKHASMNEINKLLNSPTSPKVTEPLKLFNNNNNGYTNQIQKLKQLKKKEINALFKPTKPTKKSKTEENELDELIEDIRTKQPKKPGDYYRRIMKLREKSKTINKSRLNEVEEFFFSKYIYKPRKKTRKTARKSNNNQGNDLNNLI